MRYRTYNPFLSCIGGLCGHQNLGQEFASGTTPGLGTTFNKRASGIEETISVGLPTVYNLPVKQEPYGKSPSAQLITEIMKNSDLIFDEKTDVRTIFSDQDTLEVWEKIITTFSIPASQLVAVAKEAQRISKLGYKPVTADDVELVDEHTIEAFYAIDEQRFLEYDENKKRYVEIETFEFEPNENIWVEYDDDKKVYTFLVDPADKPWKTDDKGNVIWSTGHQPAYYKNWADFNPLTETKATGTTKKVASKPVPKPKTPPKKKVASTNWPLYFLGGIGLFVGALFIYRMLKPTPARRKNPKKGGRKLNSMARYRISARKATKG